MDIKSKIKNFPLTAGVYLMKNAKGRIIYIGKAVSLRQRVSSYFSGNVTDLKTKSLVDEIADVEYINTASEAEALILEASLVKRHKPKYNISLRDDKSYPFIEITQERFPRIFLVRPRVKRKGSVYFGPYVEPRLIREALNIMRRIFGFCTCKKFPKRACLDHQIGLCSAPCIGQISQRQYARNIRKIKMILEGKRDELYKALRREMDVLARERKYEQAAVIRDQMQAIGALYSSGPDVNYFKETEQLQQLLRLPRRPERIEAFDISNIMGQQSVGSMVSFMNGKPDKSQYRRFKIKTVEGIDDVKMIAEIVGRRYARLKKETKAFPDLIVIDGGKGQLAAAAQQLAELGADIPIISLAKREEEIFVPRRRNSLVLSRDSLALRLLQRVRDEAHRFAINYHRKLRAKNVFLS